MRFSRKGGETHCRFYCSTARLHKEVGHFKEVGQIGFLLVRLKRVNNTERERETIMREIYRFFWQHPHSPGILFDQPEFFAVFFLLACYFDLHVIDHALGRKLE